MVAFKHFKIKEMHQQVRDLEIQVQREQQRMEQTIENIQKEIESQGGPATKDNDQQTGAAAA